MEDAVFGLPVVLENQPPAHPAGTSPGVEGMQELE